MTLAPDAPGLLDVLDAPSATLQLDLLAKRVDSHLRGGVSPYQAWLMVDGTDPHRLATLVSKHSGKRRTIDLSILSTLDALQTLLPPRYRSTPLIRERIAAEARRIALEYGVEVPLNVTLDQLVADQPEHPAAAAYLAGLHNLGLRHPYQDLSSLALPSRVSHIFHADLHRVPDAVLAWFLDAIPRGVSVTAVCADRHKLNRQLPSLCLPASVPEPAPQPAVSSLNGTHLCSFDTDADRREALVEAVDSGRYQYIFFSSERDLVEFELTCLVRSVCFSPSPQSSVLFSPSLRLLYTYLDWQLHSSSASLESMFEFAGGSLRGWHRFAKRHHLPMDLDAALCVAGHLQTDDRVVVLVRSIAELSNQWAFADNAGGRLEALVAWAAGHCPESLQSELALLCHFFTTAAVSLQEIHDSACRLLFAGGRRGPVLLGPADTLPELKSDSLLVPDGNRSFQALTNQTLPTRAAPVVYALKERCHG
ncbi:MAG TPA: hypothetical protein PLV87_08245 [Opitutaceae bacterium]|nr:hypothetical protein [Opitutaceae bacterium]